MVQLSGIYIYPVKSLRGLSLSEIAIEGGRFPGDRTWLLVDAGNHFMHQRDHPQMARIEVRPDADGVVLGAPNLPDLRLTRRTLAAASVPIEYVKLWRRSAPVAHVDTHADEWLTAALRVPCRLMEFVPDAPALNVPHYEVHANLHDATPFHLTAEESLADLNSRMDAPIPMNRFRPNLVVRGAAPYAEDGWKTFAIGENRFRWIKPCTRCVATTTDQQTGVRSPHEPLRALSRYRRHWGAVVFGHYVVADAWGGQLRLGDPVTL